MEGSGHGPGQNRSPFQSTEGYATLEAGPVPSGSSGKTPLFGGFFQRISEAVGATKELLYDAELRKKAVPFVLAEGGKALQEIQKGITRNAQAIGRQLQHTAAGHFQAYIGRLLERTYSRRVDRTEHYYGPVSVWVGPKPCHDMPQEVRTRFWYVLLEHPSVTTMLRPISSRVLFAASDSPDNRPKSAADHSPPPTADVDLLSADTTPGTTTTTTTAGVMEHPQHTDNSVPAASTSVPAASQPLISLDSGPQEAEAAADSAAQPATSQAQAVQGSGPEGGQQEQAQQQQPQPETQQHQALEAQPPADAQPGLLTDDSPGTPPATSTSQPSTQPAPVATSSTPAALAAVAAPTTPPAMPQQASTTAVGASSSYTPHSPLSEDSHAEEDDVLSLLDAARQQQRSQTASSSFSDRPGSGGGLRPSLSNLLQKAVDKGRTVAAAVRSNIKESPSVGGGMEAGGPALQQQGSGVQPRSSAGSQLSQPLQATTSGTQSQSQQPAQQQQPLRPGPMASFGGEGEWELLEEPPQGSNTNTDPRYDAMLRIEEQWEQCQREGSSLEQVWGLMLTVPWDNSRGGLVVEPDEDCRYLMLNEMTAGQEEVDDIIMRDIHRTFPEHPMFMGLEGQKALFRLLKAYSLHDLEVGYCQGMAFAAGVMLMYLPEEPAFRLYCQLMSEEGPNLRRLYMPELEELKAELARFEQLLSATQPALQAHLEAFGIPPVLYVSQWLMTVYTSPFPPSFCAELVDIMIQDGHDAIMMRMALTIMDELASALLHLHDFEALLTYIKITPMEWDQGHLRQLLDKAVKHTWSGPSEEALKEAASLQLLFSGGAPASDGQQTLLPDVDGQAAAADGHTGGQSTGAVTSQSGIEAERLFSQVGHVLDAEELQLDQEIAQMVRDLRLKVPAQGPAPTAATDQS